MKAYIITDSTNYEPRAKIVGSCLKKKGYEAEYIFSCFNHAQKKVRNDREPDCIYIDAGGYKKNISPARLLYHFIFAGKICKYLSTRKADLLYVMLPGNSLAPAAVKLKNKISCRLIFDIIDLWPESLPLDKIKTFPPLKYWKSLRDRNIRYADNIITECSMYRDLLGLDSASTKILYWIKKEKTAPVLNNYSSNKSSAGSDAIRVAYIGSINNIIDIPLITDILKALNILRKVELHIIGDGEKRDIFISSVKAAGINCIYHGVIYDEKLKETILRSCTWGLNIMKPGVMVGLTMKSIDYMANGLYLINNIPGDTCAMIEKYKIGVNFTGDPVSSAESIISLQTDDPEKIYNFFLDNFTIQAAYRFIDHLL